MCPDYDKSLLQPFVRVNLRRSGRPIMQQYSQNQLESIGKAAGMHESVDTRVSVPIPHEGTIRPLMSLCRNSSKQIV